MGNRRPKSSTTDCAAVRLGSFVITPTTCTRPAARSAYRAISGSSNRQGSHQDAHRLSTAGPRTAARCTGWPPAKQGRVRSGSGSPVPVAGPPEGELALADGEPAPAEGGPAPADAVGAAPGSVRVRHIAVPATADAGPVGSGSAECDRTPPHPASARHPATAATVATRPARDLIAASPAGSAGPAPPARRRAAL